MAHISSGIAVLEKILTTSCFIQFVYNLLESQLSSHESHGTMVKVLVLRALGTRFDSTDLWVHLNI